jgi:hypothetical protein
MRLFLAFTLLLLAPSSAAAAELSFAVKPPDGQVFGKPHVASGFLTEDDGRPIPDHAVVLEAREFPYDGPFAEIDDTTTDERGHFRFKRKFDRNVQLRVSAPVLAVQSARRQAIVKPFFKISWELVHGLTIRIKARYKVPADVRLRRRTIFYVGPGDAESAPVRARVKTRRRKPGRYVARMRFTLPRSWDGRFKVAGCFRYTRGSGLGDPGVRCPKRFVFED